MPKWATQEEVSEAAGGVSQQTLWRWTKLGILPEPTRIGGPRKGVHNRWPREAVERARFAREKQAEQYTLAEIAEMIAARWDAPVTE